MKPTLRALSLLLVLAACTDPPVALKTGNTVDLAKGGGGAIQRADFTITDGGLSVSSDGKGTYPDGICGVVGRLQSDILFMAPAGATISGKQKAACTGIAPRTATLTLSIRHISDNPHVDDTLSVAAYAIDNIKVGTAGTSPITTVNSSESCGGQGLRFAPPGYPGSDYAVLDDLGGGHWHVYTRPWPDNRAYCEVNGLPAFWHVSLDIYVQLLG